MSLYIRDGSVWNSLLPGSTFNREAGTVNTTEQIWVKKGGVWFPIWDFAPSTIRYARWGMAQFSDTDFTGGKSDPNQAGGPYTRWTGVQDFMDSVLTNIHSVQESGIQIDLTVVFPDYVYFAHPIEMGLADFTDNDTGFPGGWDGIHWPDGSTTTETGPMRVIYDDGTGPSYWHIYRTDFSGIGIMSWTVDFSLL